MSHEQRPNSEHGEWRRSRVPRFVWVGVATGLGALLGTAMVGVWWANQNNDRRHNFCMSTVRTREDNRSMWIWLGDYALKPGENDEGVRDMLAALNDRLPSLECVGDEAIAVEAK